MKKKEIQNKTKANYLCLLQFWWVKLKKINIKE